MPASQLDPKDIDPIKGLIASYRAYLQASIQLREIGAFGGGLDAIFRTTIREHQQAEEAYIKDKLEARAEGVKSLKAISHK